MSDGLYHFGSVVELNLPDDATAHQIHCQQLLAYSGLPCPQTEIVEQAPPQPHWQGQVPFAEVSTAILAGFLIAGAVIWRST